MSNTVGRFDYGILAPNKGEMPLNAIGNIVQKKYSSGEDGWPIPSPQFMTEQEIDWHIRACKKDQGHVGRLAKHSLQLTNSKESQ